MVTLREVDRLVIAEKRVVTSALTLVVLLVI